MRNAFAAIARAIRAAFSAMVRRTVAVSRWVGGELVQTTEAVWESAKQIGDVAVNVGESAVHLADAALALPGRVLRGMLGGGGGQSEGAAADAAAQAAAGQEASADAASDSRAMVQALRKVASARAKGVAPDPEFADRLHPSVHAYLQSLDTDELEVLVRCKITALRGLLDGGPAPKGVRSPKDLADEAAPAPAAAPTPAVRKAEFKRKATDRRDQVGALLSEWGDRAAQ